jgi:hypothetical protein
MKFIYALIISLCSATGFGYDTLAPQYYGQVVVVQQAQVATQVMVYNTPYFTVTVPVPVTVPVAIAQQVQQTVYWGYPYQPVPVNPYWNHRCRLFNFNY